MKILRSNISLYRTATNFKKRIPTATVTATEAEGEEVEEETGGEAGVDEENEENEPPDDMVTTPDRELEETPKPAAKGSGKRNDKKLEVQTRMLDILERDLETEADPLAMQFDVMAKRVKSELPKGEQFSIALQLAGIVDEKIRAYQ